MEIITSLDNKKIKNLSKLLQKKYRDQSDQFLIEGEHLVEEAYKSGNLLEIIKTEDYESNFNIPSTTVTYEVIKKLSCSVTPQKIIGVCQKIQEKKLGNKILILDNIQDPGNLGTIIRSSVAFNVDTIVLSNDTVDLYNDKVLRSSEGMLFHINIVKKELTPLIDELKKEHYLIMGTKVTNGENIKNVAIPEQTAIIMGNEGAGVKEQILAKCDKFIYIPMNPSCESLNVGVATSILLYELF